MTWNGFFALAIGPDVMFSSVAQEMPTQLTEGSLQVSSLHGLTVHRSVYTCKGLCASGTVGAGERQALPLYLGEHADAVLSDDRGFLALLSAHQTPYVTPAAVLTVLCAWDVLPVQDAMQALALLRPLIRAEPYHAARADLAALERK